MKAIVFHNVDDIRYEPDWPEPRPLRSDEVKIASSWCGICGTDMEDYKQGAVIPVGEPHPESGRMAPAQGLFLEEVIYPERFMDPGYVDPSYPGPEIAPVIDQVIPPQGETP